jgi:hypothetical protein
MADDRFEPFGESVEDSKILHAPRDDFPRYFERVGMGFFWMLVSVVVVARALYFDPDLGARFGQGVVHAVEVLVGAILLS